MTVYHVEANNAKPNTWGSELQLSLIDCLAKAKGGDIITLSPGVYQLEDAYHFQFERTDAADTDSSSDENFVNAYKNTGVNNIPVNPVIIRGETDNPKDLKIIGNMQFDNCNVAFENLTLEGDNKNAESYGYTGIFGYNASDIAFINVILAPGIENFPLVYSEDPQTQIIIASSVLQPINDKTSNFVNTGITAIYDSDIQSDLVLRRQANLFINQSKLKVIEAADNSKVTSLNSEFEGSYYFATDNATIDLSDSKVKINQIPFGYVSKNGILKGSPVTLDGNDIDPEISVSDNGKFEFDIQNTDGFYAGKQVKEYHEDESNTVLDTSNSNTDESSTSTYKAQKHIVTNNQELKNAINDSKTGDTIFLRSGNYDYFYDNDEQFTLGDVKFEGEDLVNTFLSIGTRIQGAQNSTLTFKNLKIKRKDTFVGEPLFSVLGENTNLIFDNCNIQSDDKTVPTIWVQGKDSCLKMDNVEIDDHPDDKHSSVVLMDGVKGEISNTTLYNLGVEKSTVSVSNSIIDIIQMTNESTGNIKNSTITTTILLQNGILNMNHVTLGDSGRNLDTNFISGTDSETNFNNCIINEDVKFTLFGQSRMKLHLLSHNSDNPLLVYCNNPETQIINKQNWHLNIKAIPPDLADGKINEDKKPITPADSDSPQNKFCPNCGAKNDGNGRFCSNCGYKFE